MIVVNLQMESNAKICKMDLLFGFENHIFVLPFAFEYANLQMRNISDCCFKAYLLLSL